MQEQLVATEADLTALNRFTLKELREDGVFIFSAKFIDDQPTANGRVWSREWMEAAVQRRLFHGVPFLTDHENSQTTKIGTVFSAELRDDGIHGRVFIPLDDQGRQAKEAVENGRIRSVSINADGELKRDGELTRVLPSDNMRVFEVSAVAVPGCKSCVITEQSQGGACESSDTPEISQAAVTTSLLEFARGEFETLKGEFVRVAGFALGVGINRELYQAIAERLEPLQLKNITNDLRKAYERNNEQPATTETIADVSKVAKAFEQIRKVKGI